MILFISDFLLGFKIVIPLNFLRGFHGSFFNEESPIFALSSRSPPTICLQSSSPDSSPAISQKEPKIVVSLKYVFVGSPSFCLYFCPWSLVKLLAFKSQIKCYLIWWAYSTQFHQAGASCLLCGLCPVTLDQIQGLGEGLKRTYTESAQQLLWIISFISCQ